LVYARCITRVNTCLVVLSSSIVFPPTIYSLTIYRCQLAKYFEVLVYFASGNHHHGLDDRYAILGDTINQLIRQQSQPAASSSASNETKSSEEKHLGRGRISMINLLRISQQCYLQAIRCHPLSGCTTDVTHKESEWATVVDGESLQHLRAQVVHADQMIARFLAPPNLDYRRPG
jgi:hypothetical protein